MSQELQIIEYRPTAAALTELNGKYKGVVFQVTESKGMSAAKEARAELRGYRVDLEKLRKELKAPALERSRLIDDEAKRITAALVEIENPIDSQIKCEEIRKDIERKAKEESERKAVDEIQSRISYIRNWPSMFIGFPSIRISQEIDKETREEVDFTGFGLYAKIAEEAHKKSLETLQDMLDKAISHEQEQARLEAEHVELARVQAEEKAKIEADRAELARLQAEQAERLAVEKAKAEAELQAQREAEELRMKAEREKQEAELKAQREDAAMIAAANLKARLEAEAKAQAEREAERERLAVQYAKERNENLKKRLAEIQEKDTAIENKLMLAYQMGRKDMKKELEG
jgi:colicin import membrane protein